MAGRGGRTSGMRVGNGGGDRPGHGPARGAGYGGPAQGAGNPSEKHTFAEGNQARAIMPWNSRRAELGEKAMALWERVLDDPEETTQNQIVAADKIMNRVDGLPVARVVTPDNSVSWFIEGVVEAESLDAWTQQAQLLLSKPAGHGDD